MAIPYKMFVYRIVLKSYGSSLIASGMSGRWNSGGRKVLYAAESVPLACMENMVRRKGTGFNDDFCIMIGAVPDHLEVECLDPTTLSPNWRRPDGYSLCQPFGDKWFDAGKTVVIKVPSAVFPDTSNFIFNTTLAAFKEVKLIKTIPFLPDERIEDILKNYRKDLK